MREYGTTAVSENRRQLHHGRVHDDLNHKRDQHEVGDLCVAYPILVLKNHEKQRCQIDGDRLCDVSEITGDEG